MCIFFGVTVPKIVGIINVTPDSMSDGGLYLDPERAINHAEKLIRDGAAVLDIGAESSRPGGSGTTQAVEWGRLAPVLRDIVAMAHKANVEVSVDTRNHITAEQSIIAGVDYINDVCGLNNPDMVAAVRGANVGLFCMHSLSVPVIKNCCLSDDTNAVAFIIEWGVKKLNKLMDMGINDASRIILDPGLGFGKSNKHNWDIVSNLDIMRCAWGTRVMIGHSKKIFLDPTKKPQDKWVETVALSVMPSMMCADFVRVHDVEFHARAYSIHEQYKSGRLIGY